MQRFLVFLIILFSVFNYGCATSTLPAPVTEARINTTPLKNVATPAPAVPAAPPEKPVVIAIPLISPPPPKVVELPKKDDLKAHIALLLPINSAAFGPAADAVRRGAIAASSIQPSATLPLLVYPTKDPVEDIVFAYQQALQAGAKIVIGPLTRNAVSALARSNLVTVPTLALNYPEGEIVLPENLFLFGLTAEGEARQAARRGFNDGWRTALTVAANTPLAQRVQQAFAETWRGLGGKLVAQTNFPPERTQFPGIHDTVIKHRPDFIFLAADAERARLVRPYLDANTPTYATSMVFGGNQIGRNVDLNGVLFTDMPWLLMPDHPAVMVYPRVENFSFEQERLYALGIDAFRIASIMAENLRLREGNILDGVTGQISLVGHEFQREMAQAEFSQGAAVATEFIGPNNFGDTR